MLMVEGVRGGVLGRLKSVMVPLVEEEGSHEVVRVREFVAGNRAGRAMVGKLVDG
jgi:hypothetical protein